MQLDDIACLQLIVETVNCLWDYSDNNEIEIWNGICIISISVFRFGQQSCSCSGFEVARSGIQFAIFTPTQKALYRSPHTPKEGKKHDEF